MVATSAAPAGDDAEARVAPTAQHRRAVGQVTARSVCTGAGRAEATKLPCHGTSDDEGAVVGPVVRVPENGELQAPDNARTTRAITGAVHLTTARMGLGLPGTALPFPAGWSHLQITRAGIVTV